MESNNQLVVSNGSNNVAAYHKQATDVAGVCKDIVQETAQKIGGRKYVRVEGWQAIATAHGCVASARDVEKIDGGWRAIGEVRRMDNGNVIATAEGFLGEDEPVWAKRMEYAKRAMAQTRAISRACRSAFAHVVVLIGGGLETTPAEEVPAEGFSDNHRPAPRIVDAEIVEEPRIVSRDMKSGEYKRGEPARKKQPAAAMEDGADWQTARFIKGNRQDKTSKAGKSYTQWGAFVEIEGSEKAEWLNTIDRDLGETVDALEAGENVLLQVKTDDYGRKLAAIRTSDVPAKAEQKVEDAQDMDEIPF